MQTTRYRVEGKVQGVYFRASTQREAQALGLTGWVCNCEDGAVELVATGTAQQHAKLAAWLACGPAMARVDRVIQTDEPLVRFDGFDIHY
ncbi:acylphosphatase [Saccharophagus degradans]|uniref:acylphosphatase n=1 Tax=Saccharophagus degradans TaxID=86304 RepID=UPI001C098C4E|nr:acylphosphatase [Saccharophagus degradans]MBU2985428.1 acylphosphatase [Saccharophagus degradans]